MSAWNAYIYDVVKKVFSPIRNSISVSNSESETPAIEHFLYEELQTVVITGTPLKGDYQLTLETGHGFVAPVAPNRDYLNIHYVANPTDSTDFVNNRFSQHAVVAVAGDVISISPPLAFDIDITKIEKSKRVNVNMAKTTGTLAAPRKFFTTPPDGMSWNLRRLMVDMILTSAADDGKFGNIENGLANGVFFGFESPVSLFAEYNVVVFDNGGFRSTAYDVDYTVRSGGAGDFGLSMRKTFAGAGKYGSVIRLDGTLDDEFTGYVQDNLTTIPRFRVKVMGNIAEQ
jgi:hypothetical protein